jgi:hypothetical protein
MLADLVLLSAKQHLDYQLVHSALSGQAYPEVRPPSGVATLADPVAAAWAS